MKKKNLTRILMLVSVMVICFSMVLGLAGCGPSGPDVYAAAEKNWKEADSKTATDNIKVTIDLSQVVGTPAMPNLKMTLDLTMKREYGKDGQLEVLEAKVNKAEVSGAEGILGLIGNFDLGDFDINTILINGSIVLTNFVDAKIEYVLDDDGEYVYEINGSLFVEGVMDDPIDSSEGPVVVKANDVEGVLDELGLDIPFDFLSMFDILAGVIGKDNTATVNGAAALNWITAQALDLADAFFKGTIDSIGGEEFKEEDRQIAIDAFDALAGGTSKAQLKALLDKVFVLGDVAATITYDKAGNFDKIKTTNTMNIIVAKEDIQEILEIDAVASGLGDNSKIVGSVMALLKKEIKLGITLEIETKVKIG